MKAAAELQVTVIGSVLITLHIKIHVSVNKFTVHKCVSFSFKMYFVSSSDKTRTADPFYTESLSRQY